MGLLGDEDGRNDVRVQQVERLLVTAGVVLGERHAHRTRDGHDEDGENRTQETHSADPCLRTEATSIEPMMSKRNPRLANASRNPR